MAAAAESLTGSDLSQVHAAEVILLSDRGPRRDVLEAIGLNIATAVVNPGDLGALDLPALAGRPWIIDVDLSDSLAFKVLRKRLDDLKAPRLVLLQTHDRRMLLRAQDLNLTDFFFHPYSQADLGRSVRQLLNGEVEESWGVLTQTQRAALRVSLKCFEEASERAARGEPLPVEVLKDCTRHILAATQEIHLDVWMASLRNHHNYTFRHSMFVTGTISTFAYWLGIRGLDLEHLALGALLHDIGKSKVPATLLDKPAALSPCEWRQMQMHAEHSRMMLATESWVEPEVAAMVVHHHERIDGSGYPDGLKAGELNDFVRMMAIGDTFSAMVDKRAYKAAMPKDQALCIMSSLTSELDQDIVRKFREFILD